MRTPKSWDDKSLLEDDPLASAFLAQKLSRARRSGDWVKTFAQEINRTPDHLKAAKQWIAYAFALEGTTRPSSDATTSGGPIGVDPSLLELFVQFYWQLYSGDERAAKKLVDAERKTRGFGYLLPPLGSTGASDALAAPQDAAAEAITKSPSASVRRAKPKRSRKSVVAPAVHAAPEYAAVAAEAAPNMLPGDESGLPSHGEAAVGTLGRVPCSVAGVSHSSHEGEGTQMAVVPPEGADGLMDVIVDIETISTASEEGSHAGEKVSFALEPPVAHARTQSSLNTSAAAAVAPGDSGTIATDAPAKASGPKRKQSRVDRPAQPVRERLPREAANRESSERLSAMLRVESAYHDQLKRHHPDDVDLDIILSNVQHGSPQGESAQTQKQPRKKSKKSKTRSPGPDQPSDPVAHVAHPLLVSNAEAATVPTPRVPLTATSKRGAKAKSSSVRRKIKAADAPVRPSKRQRTAEGGANAIGDLNEAMKRQMRSQTGGQGVTPHGNSGESISTATASRRKRGRSQLDATVDSQVDQPTAPGRPLAKLPRQKTPRNPLGKQAPTIPPAAALGIPANLPEADRILRGVATDALLVLHNPIAPADEWVEDTGAQDDPPSSDDEEDIPLSVVVASKKVLSASAAPSTSQMNRIVRHPHEGPAVMPPSVSYAAPSSTLLPPPAAHAVQTKTVPPPMLLKKPLTVQPIIWAESRQEVCESFDWFRSYQGGVYFNNDMVKGYLLGAFSSSRDLFARNGRLIISHGGGKAESVHSKKGQSSRLEADDQHEEDKSVRALLRTYQMGRPLVLIIDDRYALFPYDLASKGCMYVVLGFYHIAHAWAEREPANNGRGSVVRYKFAFEWCEKQPEPWWLRQEPAPESPPAPRFGAPMIFCPQCMKSSPYVYEEAWMCLKPNCPAFWTLIDGNPPPANLTYNRSFLNSAFECDHEELEDIAPLPPATGAADGVITSRRFCKGWHCKNCGRLSCRYKWEHWECKNCGATLQIAGKNRVPKEFWNQSSPAFLHHKVSADSGILVSPFYTYRIENGFTSNYHIYTLPHNRGRIYLILAAKLDPTADEIFAEYQEQARSGELSFRRWPLRAHHCRGTLLTNYFSQNTGEPYRYVGGTANTIPFEGAPSAVIKARNLIQSRMEAVMQAESNHYQFNEVLSAAYMEKQQMAFHSDAERGLGPRVASLSLGSAAYMYFRPLRKYREDKGTSATNNVLTLFLRHGDVLIMDGAEIQEYYEHTVVPLNIRFAATARYIGAQ